MLFADVDHERAVDRMAPPELPLYQAIYASRPYVNAIVHSHAPNTPIFGALDAELVALSHDAAPFVNRCSRFTMTSNTILEIETGRKVADALGVKQRCLSPESRWGYCRTVNSPCGSCSAITRTRLRTPNKGNEHRSRLFTLDTFRRQRQTLLHLQ